MVMMMAGSITYSIRMRISLSFRRAFRNMDNILAGPAAGFPKLSPTSGGNLFRGRLQYRFRCSRSVPTLLLFFFHSSVLCTCVQLIVYLIFIYFTRLFFFTSPQFALEPLSNDGEAEAEAEGKAFGHP